MSKSEELFGQAIKSIPGGVNSPVRAFKSVGGTPVFMSAAKGSLMTDVDGKEYIDYINSWGPMIMGHAYEPVVQAVREAVLSSTSFGTPTELEVKMAELICEMAPGVERIRMVNSGTEACMSAVRLARGYTGRDKIIKFAGCYHGHADCFLIEAGSGASTLGTPNSPGVSESVARDTLIARFNDPEQVKQLMEQYPDEIAALIIEPVPGNMGCIPPEEGFLRKIRELCTTYGIVLIFDEVMTGFRLAAGGAQERFGVIADLVTYGKIIGGGMPVGAFGGKAEIMDLLAPQGPVYQAGTLSGNPIAMTAGYTLLTTLHNRPEIYRTLENKTSRLKQGLLEAINRHHTPCQVNQVGSMLSVHFTDQPVNDYQGAARGNNEWFRKFFHHMLKNGIYLPPSAFETWFICHPITSEQIEHTIRQFDIFLQSINQK